MITFVSKAITFIRLNKSPSSQVELGKVNLNASKTNKISRKSN